MRQSTSHSFRPRARTLLLLGDQLIRDAGIAVFELAKNAYDADATYVRVTIEHPTDLTKGSVRVEDDGCGMTYDQVVSVWLEPGTHSSRPGLAILVDIQYPAPAPRIVPASQDQHK